MMKKKFFAAAVAAMMALTACGGAAAPATTAAQAAPAATEAAAQAAPAATEAAAAESKAEPAADKAEETKTAEPASAASEKTEEAKADKAGDKADKKLREMNVVLDWYPNAIHTFIYTAIERGYYEDEGLDVKVRFPANETDGITLVAAGKAEIGVYYQHDAIQAVANQKVGVKSIGAVCQKPLNVILSMKDKNVTSPRDFVGKTVGYGGTVLSEAMVRSMMKNVGEDPESVNLLNVGFDLMSSMTTGQVDATIGCLVNHEVPQLEEEGFEVNWFPLTDYGVPNFYEVCFLANTRMIDAEPEVLAGFLRASKKGFDDFKADPDATLQILLDNQSAENFPLSPTVEEKSAATLLPLMETADAPFLSQSADVWQGTIDWMYDEGMIERKPEIDEVMAELEY